MPEISRFLGIIIRMYYRDHLPAHFHAEYGEHEITVEIETGIVQRRFRDVLWPPCLIGMDFIRPNWLETGSSS